MNYYKKDGCQHTFTKEARALSFPVTAFVTAEQIENVVVTALECQSCYWVGIDNTTPESELCDLVICETSGHRAGRPIYQEATKWQTLYFNRKSAA